jgi:multidrug efflux pump
MQSGKFMFLQKDIKLTRPRTVIEVDRDLAGDLGIDMRHLGRPGVDAEPGLRQLVQPGGPQLSGHPAGAQRRRNDLDAIRDYQVKTAGGELVPLGTLVDIRHEVVPSKRTQFQQLNAVTLSGVMMVSLGEALEYLETTAAEIARATCASTSRASRASSVEGARWR